MHFFGWIYDISRIRSKIIFTIGNIIFQRIYGLNTIHRCRPQKIKQRPNLFLTRQNKWQNAVFIRILHFNSWINERNCSIFVASLLNLNNSEQISIFHIFIKRRIKAEIHSWEQNHFCFFFTLIKKRQFSYHISRIQRDSPITFMRYIHTSTRNLR